MVIAKYHNYIKQMGTLGQYLKNESKSHKTYMHIGNIYSERSLYSNVDYYRMDNFRDFNCAWAYSTISSLPG